MNINHERISKRIHDVFQAAEYFIDSSNLPNLDDDILVAEIKEIFDKENYPIQVLDTQSTDKPLTVTIKLPSTHRTNSTRVPNSKWKPREGSLIHKALTAIKEYSEDDHISAARLILTHKSLYPQDAIVTRKQAENRLWHLAIRGAIVKLNTDDYIRSKRGPHGV